MVPFKNAYESHQHSLKTLEVLYGYDSFLDSIEVVADFGCGLGLDSQWWANLETRDDPPEPRNYRVWSIDKNIERFDPEISLLDNVYTFKEDIDGQHLSLPTKVDLIWCHDVFQYITDPIGSLRTWNENLNVNGMLLLIFPQASRYVYNRYQNTSYNGCFYNHNIVNLMYMLALNGFDCNDAYFMKEENDPWIHAAVYKSDIAPMDPKTTSWYNLAELNLLNESVVESLNKYGHVKQEELVTAWLDKDFNYPKE